MSETNKQYAYFTVTGDFDPADISQIVGISPTTSWRKGEINPRTHRERKFSRWSLNSRLEQNRDLEAHILDVLQQLREKRSQFIEVSSKYGGIMQLVAYFNTYYPGLHFERTLVDSLAEFGLGVDFDFYYLYSDAREDS